MEPEPKAIKAEYISLSDRYIKFMLLMEAIMVTVVLTLFSASNSLNSESISDNVRQVNELADLSGTIPASNDYIVDNLFFKTRFASPGSDIQEVRDAARARQKILMSNIEKELKEVYSIKLSFLSESKIDLRIWIFLLPVLFLVSAVYTSILGKKISLLRNYYAKTDQKQSGAASFIEQINDFNREPYPFIRGVLKIIELVLLTIFLISFYSFFSYFSVDAVSDFLSGYAVLIYFCLVYTIAAHARMARAVDPDGYRDSRWMKAWQFLLRIIYKLFKRLSFRFSLSASTIILIITLFLTMSTKSCMQEKQEKIKGYELVVYFGNNQWQMNGDTSPVNYIYQFLYAFSLFISCALTYCGFFLAKRFRQNPSLRIQKLKFRVFVFTGAVFLFFLVYFAVAFAFVSTLFVASLAFFLLIMWAKYFLADQKYLQAADQYKHAMEGLLLFCLPFLLILLSRILPLFIMIPAWIIFLIALLFLLLGVFTFFRPEKTRAIVD